MGQTVAAVNRVRAKLVNQLPGAGSRHNRVPTEDYRLRTHPPSFLTASGRGENSDPEFRFDEGWPELFAEALARASRRPPGTSELSFAYLHLSLEVRRAPAVVFRLRIRIAISHARQMSYGEAECD